MAETKHMTHSEDMDEARRESRKSLLSSVGDDAFTDFSYWRMPVQIIES